MKQTPKSNQRRDDRGGRDDRFRGRAPRGNRGSDRGGSDRGGDRGGYSGNRGFNNRSRERGSENRGPNREEKPRRFERPAEDEMRRRGESGVEVSGRNVEEATEEACRRFGVTRDQLKIQVVSEGSKGFLGLLGTKPAAIRVLLHPSAVQNYAEVVLSKILKEMGLPDKVKRRRDSDGNTVLDIQGPSGGILIGRHGQTLESLQYMVAKILQRVTSDEKALVIVDVESYRERQNDKLRELAVSVAHKAKESGEEVSLRPMSARDRRVVHMALKDDAEVTTQSRGEGLRRRVVVIPKNKKAPAPVAEATPVEANPVETPVSTETPAETAEAPVTTFPGELAETAEPGNTQEEGAVPPDDIGNR